MDFQAIRLSFLDQVRIFPLCSILLQCAAFPYCLSSGWKGIPAWPQFSVQKVDGAIHWTNHYPVDNAISFRNTYSSDSDLSAIRWIALSNFWTTGARWLVRPCYCFSTDSLKSTSISSVLFPDSICFWTSAEYQDVNISAPLLQDLIQQDESDDEELGDALNWNFNPPIHIVGVWSSNSLAHDEEPGIWFTSWPLFLVTSANNLNLPTLLTLSYFSTLRCLLLLS